MLTFEQNMFNSNDFYTEFEENFFRIFFFKFSFLTNNYLRKNSESPPLGKFLDYDLTNSVNHPKILSLDVGPPRPDKQTDNVAIAKPEIEA